MVIVKSGGREYDYPDKIKELVIISKEIRDEFSEIAKYLKINKGKLIQEIYRQIILDYKTGILGKAERNITVSIKRSSISKRK